MEIGWQKTSRVNIYMYHLKHLHRSENSIGAGAVMFINVDNHSLSVECFILVYLEPF